MNIYYSFSVNEIKAFQSVTLRYVSVIWNCTHAVYCLFWNFGNASLLPALHLTIIPSLKHFPPPSSLCPPQHEVTSQFPRTGCSANSLWEPRCLCHGPNSGRCQPLSRSPCRPTSACITTRNRTVLSSSLRNTAYCVETNTMMLANSGKDQCSLNNTVLMKLCLCPHLVSFFILSVWSWEKVMLAKNFLNKKKKKLVK